jgi:hypothetical protein
MILYKSIKVKNIRKITSIYLAIKLNFCKKVAIKYQWRKHISQKLVSKRYLVRRQTGNTKFWSQYAAMWV